MSRVLSTEEFIEKAKLIHGNTYDYSIVNYVNTDTNISIICRKNGHGLFEQTPYKHLIGRGCPVCGNLKKGISQRKSKDDFIKQAKKVHTDKKYSYEKIDYRGDNKKIVVVCPKHGDFYQTPSSHLNGSGCPVCGRYSSINKRKLGIKEFIERSNLKHNFYYNYDNVLYENARTHVKIVCPLHGEFLKTPSKHLQGQGCPKCSVKNRKKPLYRKSNYSHNKISFEEFKRKSRLKYKNKFSYILESDKFNLSDDNSISIICKKHGKIKTTLKNHLYNNSVCEKCKYEDELNKFQTLMKEKHQNNYDISNSKFINWVTPIELFCDKHGFFKITPAHLKEGKGCRECGIIKRAKTQSKDLEDFILQSKEIHGNNYDYSKSVYNGARRNIKIICESHGIFEQTPTNHLKGSGCLKCGKEETAKKLSISKDEFISRARNIHGDRYDYSKSIVVKSSQKVEIICSVHGSFFQDSEHHILREHGCPRCVNKKEGELAILLDELGIVHRQYKIKNKRYDFYLPEFNILIERDGEQHYRGYFQDSSKLHNLEYQQNNDKFKTELALNNGYKIYRIPYWLKGEDIKKEIKNILNHKPTYPDVPDLNQEISKPLPN